MEVTASKAQKNEADHSQRK
jgi:RNA polymerase sigma-70 factor, ECF subfamily